MSGQHIPKCVRRGWLYLLHRVDQGKAWIWKRGTPTKFLCPELLTVLWRVPVFLLSLCIGASILICPDCLSFCSLPINFLYILQDQVISQTVMEVLSQAKYWVLGYQNYQFLLEISLIYWTFLKIQFICWGSIVQQFWARFQDPNYLGQILVLHSPSYISMPQFLHL